MADTITRDKIDELLAFLPAFEDPDTVFLEQWVVRPTHFPYPVYTADVTTFFRLAGRHWWCDLDYKPNDAGKLIRDDQGIANATLGEIKTMLTYCVRGERFAHGHWQHVLKEGRVQALLRRLIELRDSVPGS